MKFQNKITSIYFIAGHVFKISDNIDFKPALLSKIVEGAPIQADVTGNFLFFDKLTLVQPIDGMQPVKCFSWISNF